MLGLSGLRNAERGCAPHLWQPPRRRAPGFDSSRSGTFRRTPCKTWWKAVAAVRSARAQCPRVDLWPRGNDGYRFVSDIRAPSESSFRARRHRYPREPHYGTELAFMSDPDEVRPSSACPPGTAKVAVVRRSSREKWGDSRSDDLCRRGSSDVHVMLHVNKPWTEVTIAFRRIGRSAAGKEHGLSDKRLRIMVPFLIRFALATGEIRNVEACGLTLRGGGKRQDRSCKSREVSRSDEYRNGMSQWRRRVRGWARPRLGGIVLLRTDLGTARRANVGAMCG